MFLLLCCFFLCMFLLFIQFLPFFSHHYNLICDLTSDILYLESSHCSLCHRNFTVQNDPL